MNDITKKIGLQFFGNPNTNVTTDSDLSAEMKTFYDKALLYEAGPKLIHDQLAQKKPIPTGSGKTIEFRKYDQLEPAMTPLVEGVTPDGKKLKVTSMTATVAQYGDYVTLSDMLEMTAIDNNVLEATKILGNQAGITLDRVTRNALIGGTNVSYCPKLSGATETAVSSRAALDKTAKLTVDMVNQTVTKLKAQNAPTADGYYVAFINPYAAYDLKRDPEWIDVHKYSDPENIYTGEIGRIGGVRFLESTEAKIVRGKDLASDSRTLAVNGAVTGGSSQHTIVFDGGTVAADALKDKVIVIAGKSYRVKTNTASSGTATITTYDDDPITSNIDDNAVIYPEGNSTGGAVFLTLFVAQGAYGTTEIEGGGLETIVKQKGSSGVTDALNQRSSVGWKATKVAEILNERYLVRVESCSPRYSDTIAGN